jgi:hypothetical protein
MFIASEILHWQGKKIEKVLWYGIMSKKERIKMNFEKTKNEMQEII